METLEIDIINPKARKIIQELENLDLISIRKKPAFSALAKSLRQKVAGRISVEEINKEVAAVRKKRKTAK
jgi:hypothetical protein